MRYITTIDGKEFLIEILDEKHLQLNGQLFKVDFTSIGDQPVFSLLLNGKSIEAYVYPDGSAWQVLFSGHSYSALVEEEMEKQLRLALGSRISQTTEYHLKAPMPGLVIGVPVEEGQHVNKDDVLVILESMKMQNELKAPREGIVTRLRVKSGEGVEQRQIMLTLV
jgi:biotin carboxyl carrier protein